MSYTREEDRYYRAFVARVQDTLDELRDELLATKHELRNDADVPPFDALCAFNVAHAQLGDARRALDNVLSKLPAPRVEVRR